MHNKTNINHQLFHDGYIISYNNGVITRMGASTDLIEDTGVITASDSNQSTMSSPMMTGTMPSTTDSVEEPSTETHVSTIPNLVFTDNYGTTFEHSSNPSSDETTTINLGAGLKIIL